MTKSDKTLVKICGLTSETDARYVSEYGADFAGIVMFFPKSKRNVLPENVPAIINALDKNIKKVAVMVAPSAEEINIVSTLNFDYVQIHGEISAEVYDAIKLPILKAFNVKDMDRYEEYHANAKIAGYVFDAVEPGSGKTFDWSLVNNIPRDEKLLFLAGGLDATNVKEAISYISPDAVDISSKVEYADKPGKDPIKIKAFIDAVRS